MAILRLEHIDWVDCRHVNQTREEALFSIMAKGKRRCSSLDEYHSDCQGCRRRRHTTLDSNTRTSPVCKGNHSTRALDSGPMVTAACHLKLYTGVVDNMLEGMMVDKGIMRESHIHDVASVGCTMLGPP